jgi:hypothetical protein
MPEYRLYVLTGDGHIERVEEFHASDDGDALMIAKSIKKRVPCELWDHDRLVAKLPAYGS